MTMHGPTYKCVFSAVCFAALLLCRCSSSEPVALDTSDDTDVVSIADASSDVEDTNDVDVVDMRELSANLGPCTVDGDCQRGLICAERSFCVTQIGCSPERPPFPGNGCLYTSQSQNGIVTPAECTADEDCADSVYGSNCIRTVCTDQRRCVLDNDCMPGRVCAGETLCVDP